VGQFTSLRNQAVYQPGLDTIDGHIPLTEQQFFEKIAVDSTDPKAYALLVNKTVHLGLIQYWADQGIDEFHLRMPVNENYILYLASYIFPDEFTKYELLDYHQAIERGVGLCSEHAIVSTAILSEKGIPASLIGLGGHVVLQAQVDPYRNEWWIFDPDYGVVIPDNIDHVEKDPKLIAPYYSSAGYDQKTVNLLEQIYAPPENVKYTPGVAAFSPKKAVYEPLSYVLIWVIPLGLMFPGALGLFNSISICFNKPGKTSE
jgi:hypothetical protein